LLLFLFIIGCSHQTGAIAVVRPEFNTYDRVALWQSLPRTTEDYFIPHYMQAFPNQLLVERRDVAAIVGEQDILPDRLDEQTRAKLRKILGVKAIIYPSITKEGFAIKVIETDTGAITASVFVDTEDKVLGELTLQDLVTRAINALKAKAGSARSHAIPPPPADAAGSAPAPASAPQPAVRPPPRD
jgi:hypothetical protein